MENMFSTARDDLIEHHQVAMHQLLDVLFAMEQDAMEREARARTEFNTYKDEIKNRNMEEMASVRAQLESQIGHLWITFQQVHKLHMEATGDRQVAFEELKNKDETASRDIERQVKKIQRLTEELSQLKDRSSSLYKENESQSRALRKDASDISTMDDEKGEMLRHFSSLKESLGRQRASHHQQLVRLTRESTAAVTGLRRHGDKAERVLRLAEVCRKLETEKEKILPFYLTSLTEEEETQVGQQQVGKVQVGKEQVGKEQVGKEQVGKVQVKEQQEKEQTVTAEKHEVPLDNSLSAYSPMENFWKRYNKVYLDKLALVKEGEDLKKENQHLRLVLAQYLESVSVSESSSGASSNNGTTNFLMINNRAGLPRGTDHLRLPSLTRQQQLSQAARTVVEGQHVVRYSVPAHILN